MEIPAPVSFLYLLQVPGDCLEMRGRRECFGEEPYVTNFRLLTPYRSHASVSPKLHGPYS